MKQLSQSLLGSPTLPDSPCHYLSQLISTQCEFPSTDDLLYVRSLKLGGLQVKQIGSGNVTHLRPYVAKPRFLTWCHLTLALSFYYYTCYLRTVRNLGRQGLFCNEDGCHWYQEQISSDNQHDLRLLSYLTVLLLSLIKTEKVQPILSK